MQGESAVDPTAWNVMLEIERAGQRSTTTFQTKRIAEDKHVLSIGSSPLADVVIPHHAVAKTHCWLVVNDVAYTWIREARTTPGTRVDGVVIDDTARLPVGARVQVGDATIVLTAKPEPAVTAWRLALRVGMPGSEPQVHVFEKAEIIVGRSKRNDLSLRDHGVSRSHCMFRVDELGQVRVRDLDSANGVWLDGARANPNHVLRVDENVHIGDHVIALVEPPTRIPS
jgi:pSer/pThr/pTyr-binding forkhead associated (FHA) protein